MSCYKENQCEKKFMLMMQIAIHDATLYTCFFLSISKVLDKIKSSNVKKKIIYGHR